MISDLLRFLSYLICFLGFPGLALVAFLGHAELQDLRTRIYKQQGQITALAYRIDRNEYILGELSWNDEQLADEVISRCLTKEPKAPIKLKARKK